MPQIASQTVRQNELWKRRMDVCIELPRPWHNELATVEMNYFMLQDTRRDRFAALNREAQVAEQGDCEIQMRSCKV
jgi:hypothetical protein